MTEGTMLIEHGTTLAHLKPANIIQAANADLKLREKKREEQADPTEPYAFARRHVKRAHSVGHLIAMAYFEPLVAANTDKRSTLLVYSDPDLLRLALLDILHVGGVGA
jgi:hypothetical protein